MDRGARFRAPHRRSARSAHPSRSHPGDERGKLPAPGKQEEATPKACPPNVVPLLPCPTCRRDRQGSLSPPPRPTPPPPPPRRPRRPPPPPPPPPPPRGGGPQGLRSSHPCRTSQIKLFHQQQW